MSSTEFSEEDFKGMFPKMFESDTRAFQLQTLKARHHRMIDLHILGCKNSEIASTIGVTAVSVGDCLNSELGRQVIEDRRGHSAELVADHQDQIERIVEKSLTLVENILSGEEEGATASVALKAKTAMDMIKKEIPDLAVIKHTHTGGLQSINIQNIINRGAEVDSLPRTIDVQAEEVTQKEAPDVGDAT